MSFPASPEDRPDPLENMPAMRARIPEHVARGEVSTGVIVVTGGTEYVLDFVRNLPRPNMIVARVVLPHMVMPQFIDALAANVELFRQRYGELPGSPAPTIAPTLPGAGLSSTGIVGAHFPEQPSGSNPSSAEPSSIDAWPGSSAGAGQPAAPPSGNVNTNSENSTEPSSNQTPVPANSNAANAASNAASNPANGAANPTTHLRRQNPQEVYDDLKLRDEILSGAYANAVMIGHGPYEFSFDFITNFYPQSAVSCRVYLASGHIYRLLESLRASWEQLKPRLSQGNPPPSSPPPPPPR
jgi:hypothetical protein